MKFIDANAEDKKKEEKKKKEKKEQEKEGKDDKKDKKDKKKEKNVQPEVSKRPERKKNIPLIEVSSNLLLFDHSLFQAIRYQHSVGTLFGCRVQGSWEAYEARYQYTKRRPGEVKKTCKKEKLSRLYKKYRETECSLEMF